MPTFEVDHPIEDQLTENTLTQWDDAAARWAGPGWNKSPETIVLADRLQVLIRALRAERAWRQRWRPLIAEIFRQQEMGIYFGDEVARLCRTALAAEKEKP